MRPTGAGRFSKVIAWEVISLASQSLTGRLAQKVKRNSRPVLPVREFLYVRNAAKTDNATPLGAFADCWWSWLSLPRTGLKWECSSATPVGMIREVVGLGTELEPILPEDGEGLDHRDIPVNQAGRVNIVANAMLKIKRPSRGRSPERSSGPSCRGKPLRAAGSTLGTGEISQVPYPSVLHPELARRIPMEY